MDKVTGSEFLDKFVDFREDLWTVIDDRLVCMDEYCVLSAWSSIEYLYAPHFSNPKERHHYMSLTLRNDCYADECCDTYSCTIFKGGFVGSLDNYGYGSFRFYARAVSRASGLDSDGVRDAYCCFSLESNYEVDGGVLSNKSMSISLCVSALDPDIVLLGAQNGNETFHKGIEMEFSLADLRANFRIDWHPNFIRWYVNDGLLASVSHDELEIPDAPMMIKLGIMPFVPWEYTRSDVQISMNIFRARYLALEGHLHDELFVQGRSSSMFLRGTLFACAVLLIILLFSRRFWKQEYESSFRGDVYMKL